MSPRGWSRLGLLAPLGGFLLAFFVLPLAWLLSLAVRDAEVGRALPLTLQALAAQGWKPGQPVPESAFAPLAVDLARAREAQTLADAARRLNYAMEGSASVRSALMRAGREALAAGAAGAAGGDPPAGSAAAAPRLDRAWFEAIDPVLASPGFFAALHGAAGPLSDFYLLAALDLQHDASGAIARAPSEQRIYLDVLGRTLAISASVTLLCLLLGFPVAALLARASGRTQDLLMALVMLPFWTSLLVRTAAWVVLLQKEGLVNSLLMKLGLIGEPLALIYNRSGVLVAMTHVLLPFMILPLVNVLREMPPTLMRAASSLGARPLTAFFRVYLPLAAPGIAAGSLMVFIMALGYYITPALVGGGGDQMLSYFVAKYTTETGNWGLASALGVVLLATTLALYALAQRLGGARGALAG